MADIHTHMETGQIIRWLRDHAKEAPHPSWARMMNAVAEALVEATTKVEVNIYDQEEI